MNAVSQGIQDAMIVGTSAGFELTDVCGTVEDGSYHDDSPELSRFVLFRTISTISAYAFFEVEPAISSVTLRAIRI